MEGLLSWEWLTALSGILLLDLVLSGDNAILIALACKNLPQKHHLKAMVIGCAGAVIIRIILTVFATKLLSMAGIQFIGGLALFYIALKLLDNNHHAKSLKSSYTLIGAIKTIMLADFIMSIDNVLSMAGVANTVPAQKWSLIICGLVISLPIVIGGAQLFLFIMNKFPALIYAGSAILGFTSAKMLLMDNLIGQYLLPFSIWLEILFISVTILWGLYKNGHSVKS
nr:YjbE family putative metal transport protein [Pectinatus sottacetonis]